MNDLEKEEDKPFLNIEEKMIIDSILVSIGLEHVGDWQNAESFHSGQSETEQLGETAYLNESDQRNEIERPGEFENENEDESEGHRRFIKDLEI